MRTLTLGLGVGIVAGMAMATAAINTMYPDLPKRMLRDGRRAVRCTRRAINNIIGQCAAKTVCFLADRGSTPEIVVIVV